MRRSDVMVGTTPSVRISDVAYSVGGRRKLRMVNQREVSINHGFLTFKLLVNIVHMAMLKGGTRAYFECPWCHRRATRLFFDPETRALRCGRDWGRLKYPSQRRSGRVYDDVPPSADVALDLGRSGG
jgi:hypothetical protein